MTEKQRIKENLCSYDKRSPYYDKEFASEEKNCHDEFRPQKKDCYCDNCFYGRTWMAERLIELYWNIIKREDNEDNESI